MSIEIRQQVTIALKAAHDKAVGLDVADAPPFMARRYVL